MPRTLDYPTIKLKLAPKCTV